MIISVIPFFKQRYEERFHQTKVSFDVEPVVGMPATQVPVYLAGRAIPTVSAAQTVYTVYRAANYIDNRFPEFKRALFEGSMDAWRHHMGITGESYYRPESFGPKGHGKFKAVGHYRGGSVRPRDFV